MPGRLLALPALGLVLVLVLVSGCTGFGQGTLNHVPSAAPTVTVPTCARPPCDGGPGSIRWSRGLPTGPWVISEDGDYRINQTPPPSRGSTNEVAPAIFSAGTSATLVLSLADHVLAFDARTGATVWSLPASRLPAHSVITGVDVTDGTVGIEVTQEFPAAADWRYREVLVDLTSGRIQADIPGYHAGLVLATSTRFVLENGGVLQGVDRATGRILWTHPTDKNGFALVAALNGRLLLSLPPKPGNARSLATIDPSDGKTVDTISEPHDVYSMQSRGDVLYFAGPGRAYAYNAVTRKTLWAIPLPAGNNLYIEVDLGDGTAYVGSSLPRSPYTSTLIRVELSGRRTAIKRLGCELRGGTVVDCPNTPSLTSRVRGGPVDAPTSWQSPPIPELSQLYIGDVISAPAGPGPTYTAGVSCPTSELVLPPSPSPSSRPAAIPAAAPARPVCTKPYLVAVNRT